MEIITPDPVFTFQFPAPESGMGIINFQIQASSQEEAAGKLRKVLQSVLIELDMKFAKVAPNKK